MSMTLAPVKTSRTARYPSLLVRQARRFASATALSVSLLAGGCAAPSAETETARNVVAAEKQDSQSRRLRVCEPQPRRSGDMIAPAIPEFSCGPAPTASMPELSLPFHPVAARLCRNQTAWSRVRVPTRARYRFLLQGATTRIEMISPSGDRVFTLTNAQSCVELDMEPGLWILAARPTSADVGDHGFELWADPLP